VTVDERLAKLTKFVYLLLIIVILILFIEGGYHYFSVFKKRSEVPQVPGEKVVRLTEVGVLEKAVVCDAGSFAREFGALVYSNPLKVPDFWVKELEEKGIPVPIDIYRIKGTVSKIWEESPENQLMWELTADDQKVVIEVNRQPPPLTALTYKWPGDPKDGVREGDQVAILLAAICPAEDEPRLVFYSYTVFHEE
jgi:hypothetical protein